MLAFFMIMFTTRFLLVFEFAAAFKQNLPRAQCPIIKYGVPPRSPRPEQYYDEEKTQRAITQKIGELYDPEYDDDIASATRKLFELRMRKSQGLRVRTHEFKQLRKFIARLKTQKRADEIRTMGVEPRKRKPRTRREREKLRIERIRKEERRVRNRKRLQISSRNEKN